MKHADWYDPELNPKLRSFCQHYGVAILPTRPYTPRHKGKIERGVGYVKSNSLKARTFGNLADQIGRFKNSPARIWIFQAGLLASRARLRVSRLFQFTSLVSPFTRRIRQ